MELRRLFEGDNKKKLQKWDSHPPKENNISEKERKRKKKSQFNETIF